MAKKKTKSAPKSSKSKSHGQLFDSHPNLKWLLPVFFILAVLAVLAMKNSTAAWDSSASSAPAPVTSATINSTVSPSDTTNSTTGY